MGADREPGSPRVAPPCVLCGSEAADPVVEGRDLLHGRPGVFPVVRCRSCGLCRTSPRPRDEDLPLWYPEDYEPHAPDRPPRRPDPSRAKDRVRLEALRRRFGYRHLQSRARPWERWLAALWWRPPFRLPAWRGEGRALDVGCGAGAFLQRLAWAGWSVQGVEPSAHAVARARAAGLEVWHGSLEDLPEDGRRFDLVRLASVLEHVPDPVATLRLAAARLAERGEVHLVVPNLASLTFRLFRGRWFPLDLPRHLHHFTPATLARVARAAGLEVHALRHDSGPRAWQRSLSHRFPGPGGWWTSRGARRLLGPLAWTADRLGSGDSLRVVLRRAGSSTHEVRVVDA